MHSNLQHCFNETTDAHVKSAKQCSGWYLTGTAERNLKWGGLKNRIFKVMFTEASAGATSLRRGLGARKIWNLESRKFYFQHSPRDISSKNKSESSIKSHVFSVLTSNIAEIFELYKSTTCVACWGNVKKQWCKIAWRVYISRLRCKILNGIWQISTLKQFAKFWETVKG